MPQSAQEEAEHIRNLSHSQHTRCSAMNENISYKYLSKPQTNITISDINQTITSSKIITVHSAVQVTCNFAELQGAYKL